MIPFIYLGSSIFFFNSFNHIIIFLLDYFINSLSLAIGVGFLSFVMGTVTAWLDYMTFHLEN